MTLWFVHIWLTSGDAIRAVESILHDMFSNIFKICFS